MLESDDPKPTLEEIRSNLAGQLGSLAGADAWLTSPHTGYPTTALDAINAGHAAFVLEDIERSREGS